MSHKEAPPLTDEQRRMMAFYDSTNVGHAIGWGVDKNGQFLGTFARNAWAAWNEAKRVIEI